MRSFVTLLPAMVVTLLCVACRRTDPPPLIGLVYSPGVRAISAARLAAMDLARADPRKPVRVWMDSSIRGVAADIDVRRAQRLVANPRVMAVVGPTDSRSALAVAPVFNAAGVAQVNAEATSSLVHRIGGRLLALAPNDSAEGALIAGFLAARQHARSLSIFYANDEYGTGLRDAVASSARALGLTLLDEVPFTPESDFRVLLEASFMHGRPDAIVVAGRVVSTSEILKAALATDSSMTVVAGDGALVPDKLRARAGPALDSLYIVSLWLPDSLDTLQQAFRQRFLALAGREPEPVDAYVYDGVMVAGTAIRHAGMNRDAVWAWLASLGRTRPPFRGVTGAVTVAGEVMRSMHVARIRNSHIEPVWSP